MSRLVLIDWNASEGEEGAERLRRAGHEVVALAPRGGAADLRALLEDPPEAFVIDLGRLPSQGLGVAVLLRQWKATRRVPIVFAGGDPEKVARVRKLLPDAVYTEWTGIRGALRRATGGAPPEPVVSGTMDGYSGRPLAKKLGIRTASTVALLGAPAGFSRKLGTLPEDVRFQPHARSSARVIVLFVRSRADLGRRFPAAVRALETGGALWVAWPKQASGAGTDLTQQAVRAFGLGSGFVDYKICAIDETWSGLCFARRRPARAARPAQRPRASRRP